MPKRGSMCRWRPANSQKRLVEHGRGHAASCSCPAPPVASRVAFCGRQTLSSMPTGTRSVRSGPKRSSAPPSLSAPDCSPGACSHSHRLARPPRSRLAGSPASAFGPVMRRRSASARWSSCQAPPPPAHARIQLQGRTTAAWHALLSASFHGDNFTLHWHVRARDFQLRAVLLSGRHRIATSAVASLLVGSAIVRCHPAAAPANLPAGDGWIEGGVYL